MDDVNSFPYLKYMKEIFKLIGDLGFPVAAAMAGGYFVYLTIKLLLGGVLGSVKGMVSLYYYKVVYSIV